MEPWAVPWSSPVASKTWEGSKEPEVQAEPLEAAMPSISRSSKMDSPSTYLNEKLTLLANLLVGCPLRTTSGILFLIPSMSLFLRPVSLSMRLSKFRAAISTAFPKPTIFWTPSVPALLPLSWPLPVHSPLLFAS